MLARRWRSDALFDRSLPVGAEIQEIEAAATLVAAVRDDPWKQEEHCPLNGAAVRTADLVRGAGWAPLLAEHFVCLQ